MPHDRDLVQLVDSTMAEAVRISGSWIACKIGCTACCIGPFPITRLDAIRLREGLAALDSADPCRAARLRERTQQYIERIRGQFPGDCSTGILAEGPAAEERFAVLAEEEPCPVLDPETGACDLYASRPITCRTFGPAVSWNSGAVGACELCYEGASDEQIAACRVDIDPQGLENALLADLDSAAGCAGQTIVAFALL